MTPDLFSSLRTASWTELAVLCVIAHWMAEAGKGIWALWEMPFKYISDKIYKWLTRK